MAIEKISAELIEEKWPDIYSEIFEAGAATEKKRVDDEKAEHRRACEIASLTAAKERAERERDYYSHIANQAVATVEPGANFMSKVNEYKAKHNCKNSEAVKAMVKAFPDLHKQYIRETNA